jgi:hypothetical protein
MADKIVIINTAFALPGQPLDVAFSADSAGNLTAIIKQEISLADLAKAIGIDIDGVPDVLLPRLSNIGLLMDRKSRLVVAIGKLTLLYDTKSKDYLVTLHTDLAIALSDLPVINTVLPASENLGLGDVGFSIASKSFSTDEISAFNLLVKTVPGATPFPAKVVQGKVLMANLTVGDQITPLSVAFAGGDGKAHKRAAAAVMPAKLSAGPATTGAWVNIQKSLGPVSIRRVGLGYHESKFWLMLDAGFLMAGLEIELAAARIGFLPVWPPQTPSFEIDGLDLDYHKDEISIVGGLIRTGGGDTAEYDGQILLSAETYLLSAVASYTKVDGHASMFAFAELAAPIGGPPFCFVTGAAAGFGLNRDLIIPSIDHLKDFPLVRAVNGDSPFPKGASPKEAVDKMQAAIPPRYGENWVALGLRFTTFELLKSSALVTARFGSEVEIDLLGFSTLSVPADADTDPIAFAELAIVASFRPADGTLQINGQLTPASYVISKNCHLVGGFAIWSWFKDFGGAKAGDFVVTLGGYHPAFRVPSFYPQVPRIGANWQVSGDLLIKGGFYFALTPNCVMAGGFLDATWSSGDISAWFSVYADFLLSWKPFYYEADMGISIGASFTVDLLFTSFTITIHVGVDLSISGPEFAGTARVHLYIISFTIGFGGNDAKREAIAWDTFKTTFLPKRPPPRGDATPRFAAVSATAAGDEDDPGKKNDAFAVCTVVASKGLIKDLTRTKLSENHPDWVINAEQFELVASSAIPIKRATLTVGSDKADVTGDWSLAFGVGPVDVKNEDFHSVFDILVQQVDLTQPTPVPSKTFKSADFGVTIAPQLRNVPNATWLRDIAMADPKDAGTVLNTPSATVDKALVGIALTASQETSDTTPLPMDIARLQFEQTNDVHPLYSTVPKLRTDDPVAGGRSRMDYFVDRLKDEGVAARRSAIAAALEKGCLISLSDPIDTSAIAAQAPRILQSAPTLAFLGEEGKVTNKATLNG